MPEALHNGDVETRETGAIAAEWTRASRNEVVRRVVQSYAFARSERLSSFLVYVCDMALKGRSAELNEQRIGHAVFGRARDYDSSIDGIVRTQASRFLVATQNMGASAAHGELIAWRAYDENLATAK